MTGSKETALSSVLVLLALHGMCVELFSLGVEAAVLVCNYCC